MDKTTLSNLIEQSKHGNRKATEQLLIYAYTPVLWQCRRLLNDSRLAEEMTAHVLKSLASQVDSIEGPDHFHKWLSNVTALRCMKKREQTGIREYISDSKDAAFPSNELSKEETARVAQILADALPEKHRICLILSACCSMSTKAIAQMTRFSEESVSAYVTEAEQGIREQMRIYRNQGIVFAGSLSVPVLLRNAMLLEKDHSAAAVMARKVLPPNPKPPVQPPKRPNHAVKALMCVAVMLLLLLVFLIWGIFRSQSSQEAKEPTDSTTIVSTTAEVTAAATQSTTHPTTEPITQPTTEETTEPTTEATEETTVHTETEKQEPISSSGGSGTQINTGAGGAGNAPSGSEGYDPGQGEDGHVHQFFTMPVGDSHPSCTRAAQIYRICSICHHGIMIDDPDRPALGHDYHVNIVVPPTTTNPGYTNYLCSRCHDNYDADYVDPIPEPEPPMSEPQAPESDPSVPET